MDDEEPPLTSRTCAICAEEQTFHVVTPCCKPDAPSGHEPLVCFDCFATMVNANTAVTCPLCRAPVHHFKKVRTADLREHTVLLEMQEAVSVLVRVRSVPTTTDTEVVLPTVHRVRQPPFTADTEVVVPPVPAPLRVPRNTQPPVRPRSSLSLFQQHIMGRESMAGDALFSNSLRQIEGNVLAEAYRAFVRNRVYQRMAWQRYDASSACTILLPELLRSPAHLIDDGLCVSCLFPIHFHVRR